MALAHRDATPWTIEDDYRIARRVATYINHERYATAHGVAYAIRDTAIRETVVAYVDACVDPATPFPPNAAAFAALIATADALDVADDAALYHAAAAVAVHDYATARQYSAAITFGLVQDIAVAWIRRCEQAGDTGAREAPGALIVGAVGRHRAAKEGQEQ